MILCELAKAIAHHWLTGLNIIIFHDFMMVCLIFHTAIIINRNNWRKCEHTHMLGSPPPVCFYLLFNDPAPLSFSTNVLSEWPLDISPVSGANWPLWDQVKSRHFIERIDARRQYFYFLYKFLGITDRKKTWATFLNNDLNLLLSSKRN